MADSSAVAEPVAILPSGKPSESSITPVPSSAPSPKAAVPNLFTQIAKAPAHTDDFLTHLQRTMQSRAGTDAVLMFLCYATRLAGSTLELGGRTALRISARQLVATLFKLPPSTTTVVIGSATMPPAVAWAMDLGGRFKAYSAMLSEMRCMGRLWGMLGLYFALKKLVVKNRQQAKASQSEKVKEKTATTTTTTTAAAAESQFDNLLAWAQIISLIVFQSAENVAYLSSKKVLPFSPKTQGRLAILSVRSWGLYVAMEASRLLIEHARKRAALGPQAATVDVAWAEGWKKAFYRNLSWAPLTVHWGVADGPLPDVLVSLLGFYPAASAMRDMWKASA